MLCVSTMPGRFPQKGHADLLEYHGPKGLHGQYPSEEFVEAVDYFGMASGKSTDKFAASGLTPVRSDLVDAPPISGSFPSFSNAA